MTGLERWLAPLDRWVPPSEGITRFRGRMVVAVSLYASALLLVFCPVWAIVAGPWVAVGCATLAVALLAVGEVQRRSGSVVVGATALLAGCYLLELWALALTGGLASPFTGVAWVVVLYAGVLLGYRGGLLHAAILAIGTLLATAVPWPAPVVQVDAWWFAVVAVPPAALTCALVLGLLERYGASSVRREARAREDAERASRSKSDFLGVVSHELRTPLASILGAAELLERRLVDSDAALAATIKQCGSRLSLLVEDLLDLRAAEAGAISTTRVPFAPREVVRLVVDTVSRARPLPHPIAVVFGDETPAHLSGDPSRLHQVVLNLVVNAVRHGGAASVAIRVSGALRIEVSDRGPGIAPGDLERVFEPFTRLDSSYGRSTEGSGLGLAISRRLVHAMDGQIGVESVVGQGTTFWIEVPMPEALDPDPGSESTDGEHDLVRRLLVVDDQDVVRDVFVQMLVALGHEVESADSATAAVQRCSESTFDLVLMDIAMPEVDGIEGARRLREVPSFAGTRLVALTANASAADRARYLEAGFDDVVAKPATLRDLRTAVARRGRGLSSPGAS